MTIDEAVKYIEEQKEIFGGTHGEFLDNVLGWLKELKVYKGCNISKVNFSMGYNKAIDDCKTYIGLHRRYAEHSIDDYVNYLQMASWLNNKLAEQINPK